MSDYIHWRQIPTKKRVIKTYLGGISHNANSALLRALTSEQGSYYQKNKIVIDAALFERLSCLVYRGSDGPYHKLPDKEYRRGLFEAWAETLDEVCHLLGKRFTLADAEHIHKLIWQVADLVCPMMALESEQFFVGEYAYAIEYVIRHDGVLPKPEIKRGVPSNYKDYNDNEGIAEEIEGDSVFYFLD